jgi:hypothetical protein
MQTAQTMTQAGTLPVRSNHHADTALKMYKNEQAFNLTPVEMVKRMYDLAIIAGKKNDTEKAQRIVRELIIALDYSHGALAVQLFHLYQYCIKSLREDRVDEAISLLEDLRNTWAEAFNL